MTTARVHGHRLATSTRQDPDDVRRSSECPLIRGARYRQYTLTATHARDAVHGIEVNYSVDPLPPNRPRHGPDAPTRRGHETDTSLPQPWLFLSMRALKWPPARAGPNPPPSASRISLECQGMIFVMLILTLWSWLRSFVSRLARGFSEAVPGRLGRTPISGLYNAPHPDGQGPTSSLPGVCHAYTPEAAHPGPVHRPSKCQPASRTTSSVAAAKTGRPAGSVTARAPRLLDCLLSMQREVVSCESISCYRLPLFSGTVPAVNALSGVAQR